MTNVVPTSLESIVPILVVTFLVALAASLVVGRLLLQYPSKLLMGKSIDPDALRWTSTSKPTCGGVHFYVVFLIATSMLSMVSYWTGMQITSQVLGIVSATTVAFLVGMIDDVYDVKTSYKFGGQLLAAHIVYLSGVIIDVSGIGLVNYAFTIFWVLACINSINMMDNMDGIVGTVSVSILSVCLVSMALTGTLAGPLALLMVAVIGAIAGFMFFNWHPATMYMGDKGSHFLGVFLAAVGAIYLWNFREVGGPAFQPKQFLLPMMVFAIPMIDTFTVIFRRLRAGRSPFIGTYDHLTHNVAFLGFKDNKVAIIFACVSGLTFLGGISILQQTPYWQTSDTSYYAGMIFLLFLGFQSVYVLNGRFSVKHAEKKSITEDKAVLQMSNEKSLEEVRSKSAI